MQYARRNSNDNTNYNAPTLISPRFTVGFCAALLGITMAAALAAPKRHAVAIENAQPDSIIKVAFTRKVTEDEMMGQMSNLPRRNLQRTNPQMGVIPGEVIPIDPIAKNLYPLQPKSSSHGLQR